MDREVEDYKEWLIDYLGVDNLEEEADIMDDIDFLEYIMEFEKRFNCVVNESNYEPRDFETLSKYVDFLIEALSKP